MFSREELIAVKGVIYEPLATLTTLPSAKIYSMSLLIYVLATFVINWPDLAKAISELSVKHPTLGVEPRVIVLLSYFFLLVVLFWISCWFVVFTVRLFGKRLSFKKVFNISGYATLPTLLSPILAMIFSHSLVLAKPQPLPIALLIALPLVYSIVLFFVALVKTKGE
jgi:hypothetical protein